VRRFWTLLAVFVAVAAGCGEGSGNDSSPAAGDRFDAQRAFPDLRAQVRIGPRPAGSPASRQEVQLISRRLREAGVPEVRVQHPHRNVIGHIPGESSGTVVVGAHHDTKDIPGFVGANDGASGTAVVTQLARSIRPRRLRKTLVFVLFDGEESPAGVPDSQFEQKGLRGSKVAARRYRRARAMVLLDFVGDKHLRIPREANSSWSLWHRMREAARRVGVAGTFPPIAEGPVADDHSPFIDRGVPAIDLIDFDFSCFHRTCDNLGAVSERSLDRVGETMMRYLASL
jgi:glutaminyl-peptide cyclotransferase